MAKTKTHTVNRRHRDEFLHEYGISYNAILYTHRQWETNESKTIQLFEPDNKGNMRIYYPTLDGHIERHQSKGEHKISFRTRIALPFTNQKGDEVKYLTEGKNCIYFPPQMVAAYQRKIEVPVLIVTEGEKKAFVACKNGFDCVGISGIWNFCEKYEGNDDNVQGGLLPSLKEFIKVCKVTKVVLLHDSDALDISNSQKKAPTDRPANFCKSVQRFAELVFQEGAGFYYSYINPHLGDRKYGLDDLIKDFETYDQRVLMDFHEGVNGGKFTSYFCTTHIQYIKNSFIRGIFQLNDPQEFFNYHKAKLGAREEFRFENRVFTINKADGKITEKKYTGLRSVWPQNGKYYAITQNGSSKEVSNFTMQVLFLLKSNSNPKRIVEFKNVLGKSFVKELNMDDLVSISNFRKKLIGDGSFIYKGDIFEMLNLQEMLFKEEKVATEITTLGWQKNYGFFAFSNGVTSAGRFFPVNEYGVVSFHEDLFYLPAFSNLYDEAEERLSNERKFKHTESDVTFEEWAQVFYNAYKDNGALALAFGISSLFSDIAFSELGFFPLLNLFGQKGSGKSAVAHSLLHLFGTPQTAISLESSSSTNKGVFRKFAQFRNAIVWLDEYKNTIHPNAIGMLKNLWDRIGYDRAQTSQDYRTHGVPVFSSAVISGQDMPTADPALLTRVILLMFKNNNFTSQDQQHWDALKQVEARGITSVTIKLLGYRDKVDEGFKKSFKHFFSHLAKQFEFEDIPDRLLKNAAAILAPVDTLLKAEAIKLPFSIDELVLKTIAVLKQHKTLLSDNQEISVFWDVVETLFDERVLSFENGDFKFFNDTLAVRFNRVFAAYSEKFRKMHGRNGLDKLTISNYLKNSAAFLGIKDSVRFETNVSSAYMFKYKELGINLQRLTKEAEGAAQANTEGVPDIVRGDQQQDLPY